MQTRVVHRIDGANESGHVVAGFFGQVGADFPVSGSATRITNRLRHVARPRIVGGQGQLPAAKDVVHLLQVAAGSVGALVGIHALVHVGRDFQTLQFARRIHELPKTFSAHGTRGRRVHSALNDGQVLELHRHVVAVQSGLKDGEVVARTANDAAQEFFAAPQVKLDGIFNVGREAQVHRRTLVQGGQALRNDGFRNAQDVRSVGVNALNGVVGKRFFGAGIEPSGIGRIGFGRQRKFGHNAVQHGSLEGRRARQNEQNEEASHHESWSRTRAAWKSLGSSKGPAIICIPKGRPFGCGPAGMFTAGMPAIGA